LPLAYASVFDRGTKRTEPKLTETIQSEPNLTDL